MILPVTSGDLRGPGITGTIQPMSGDWLLVRPDGVGELKRARHARDARGALIYVTYVGYVTNVPELMPRWQLGEEIPRDRVLVRRDAGFPRRARRHTPGCSSRW